MKNIRKRKIESGLRKIQGTQDSHNLKYILKPAKKILFGKKGDTRGNRQKSVKNDRQPLFSVVKYENQSNKCLSNLQAINSSYLNYRTSFFASASCNATSFQLQGGQCNISDLERTCNSFAPHFSSTPLFSPFHGKNKNSNQTKKYQEQYYNKIRAEAIFCLGSIFAEKEAILGRISKRFASTEKENSQKMYGPEIDSFDIASALRRGHPRMDSLALANTRPHNFCDSLNDTNIIENKLVILNEDISYHSWKNKVPNSDNKEVYSKIIKGKVIALSPSCFTSFLSEIPRSPIHKNPKENSTVSNPSTDTALTIPNESDRTILFPINNTNSNSKNLATEMFSEFKIPNLPTKKTAMSILPNKKRMIANESKDEPNSSLFSHMRPLRSQHLNQNSQFRINYDPSFKSNKKDFSDTIQDQDDIESNFNLFPDLLRPRFQYPKEASQFRIENDSDCKCLKKGGIRMRGKQERMIQDETYNEVNSSSYTDMPPTSQFLNEKLKFEIDYNPEFKIQKNCGADVRIKKRRMSQNETDNKANPRLFAKVMPSRSQDLNETTQFDIENYSDSKSLKKYAADMRREKKDETNSEVNSSLFAFKNPPRSQHINENVQFETENDSNFTNFKNVEADTREKKKQMMHEEIDISVNSSLFADEISARTPHLKEIVQFGITDDSKSQGFKNRTADMKAKKRRIIEDESAIGGNFSFFADMKILQYGIRHESNSNNFKNYEAPNVKGQKKRMITSKMKVKANSKSGSNLLPKSKKSPDSICVNPIYCRKDANVINRPDNGSELGPSLDDIKSKPHVGPIKSQKSYRDDESFVLNHEVVRILRRTNAVINSVKRHLVESPNF